MTSFDRRPVGPTPPAGRGWGAGWIIAAVIIVLIIIGIGWGWGGWGRNGAANETANTATHQTGVTNGANAPGAANTTENGAGANTTGAAGPNMTGNAGKKTTP